MQRINSWSSTDNVSLLSENVNIINNKTEPLLTVSKDVSQEANAGRTKCMITSSTQRVGQKHDMTVGNKSF
jgi:hypothetical protein